ncbi:MAG: HAMP domain-containing sensor histidine kinase [Spirochaetales bacterium]|nr:HAMP domain-containing sensor histidine kinase [Spirochaetales bacterium]
MKISLTARLILIMILSVFLSSLVSILFVSRFTVNKVRGLNNQRDINISLLVAEALTVAATEGELNLAVSGFGGRELPLSGSEGRQGMMRKNMPGRDSVFRGLMPADPHIMAEGGAMVPILITDSDGRILKGQFRTDRDRNLNRLDENIIKQGAPFYAEGKIAGYVLAGNMAGQNERGEDQSQLSSMIRAILLYPIVSALLASLLGIFLLRRALRPLQSLYEGVQTIQKGEYSYRVKPVESRLPIRDDLTILSEGFNEMASSLEASEEWKKQIISDTAHELRTPVSLIMGNLEMILDGVYKADRKKLESLYRESTVLAALIRDLQVLASEEAGQSPMEKRDFSINELVDHTAEDFRALAHQKKIEIQYDRGDDLKVSGDPVKTRQVLKNLMVNALRHTPEGGWIQLRIIGEKDYIIVEVEDSGEGIPPDFREKIFNRFFKMDQSRGSEGSGLGLSISRILIENQGGRLTAHEGEDGGALFRISFPVK